MFANHIFGKGFVSKKKYKEFIKLDNKKTKNSIKHRQMIWANILPKRICKGQIKVHEKIYNINSHFRCLVAQSCLALCDPINCRLPDSSVHGISQARTQEWVAISFSRDPPDPGIKPMSPASAGWFCSAEPPGKRIAN